MNKLHTLLPLALAFCLVAPPAVAGMKPVSAGKVESAAEKRARILESRKRAQEKKEQAAREAASARERYERAEQERREREEAAAANREYYERQERLREEERAREKAKEEQARAAEEEKWRKISEDITQAGLPEDWKQQRGLVKVDSNLRLICPLLVFHRDSEAERYMTWLRSDTEAAREYALERVRNYTAFLLPAGSKVLVTSCGVEDEYNRIPVTALFYVESTDGTEGWASNLILRQHRVPEKKGRKAGKK